MENEQSKDKRRTASDIAKKYNEIIDLRERVLDKLLKVTDETIIRSVEKAREAEQVNSEVKELLDKIFMLRWVMVSKTGDMSYSMEGGLSGKEVFTEDDMITLKGKMMELVKKL